MIKALIKFLLIVKGVLGATHDSCSRYIFTLNQHIASNKNITQQELDELAGNLESFLSAPKGLADSLLPENGKYKEIVFIYFVMKQTSAIYEAESKQLPIQVFNEMRNALDHFVRSLIYPNEEDRESKNIEQMNRHIQRAFLDTSKLLCAFYDEKAKYRHSKFSDEAVGVLNQGDYQKEFTSLQNKAHETFTNAKLLDYKLGTENSLDVREEYISAVIAHKKLLDYQTVNYPKLKWMQTRISLLKGMKWSSAIFASLIAGVFLEVVTKKGEIILSFLKQFILS